MRIDRATPSGKFTGLSEANAIEDAPRVHIGEITGRIILYIGQPDSKIGVTRVAALPQDMVALIVQICDKSAECGHDFKADLLKALSV